MQTRVVVFIYANRKRISISGFTQIFKKTLHKIFLRGSLALQLHCANVHMHVRIKIMTSYSLLVYLRAALKLGLNTPSKKLSIYRLNNMGYWTLHKIYKKRNETLLQLLHSQLNIFSHICHSQSCNHIS